MMRGTLTFRLPEEQDDFEMSFKGVKSWCALQHVWECLRRRLKYEDVSEDARKELESLKKLVAGQMNDIGIDW